MDRQNQNGRREENSYVPEYTASGRTNRCGDTKYAAAVETRVLNFMKENSMADGGSCVLAAVSGGADSVCLLILLAGLRERLGLRLAALHLNHGLRGGEAARDELFVRKLCRRLSVPCTVIHENVRMYANKNRMSEEEAGRELRYRHLEAEADRLGGARIAVAHHRDDNAETILLNLFRGAGLRGLGGIRPVRGRVIRPLLCISREEILRYLTVTGNSWCEDSSNMDNVYVRNRIRNSLLPWVREQVNERAAEHILAFAELAEEADGYFTDQAERILRQHALSESRSGGREISIPAVIFDAQPRIVRAYIARAMIEKIAEKKKNISERHIDAVLALTGPGGGREINLPWGLKAERGYERLTVFETKRSAASLDFPDLTAVFRVFPAEKGVEFPKNQYTKWFDYDKIKGTLCIRPRKSGDFLVLAGGVRKTVRRFMIDEKIPSGERGMVPVLADENQVIWVIGYRISEYYKITNLTENILEVRICKGEGDDG